MALVINPLNSGQASGSLGGVTYQRVHEGMTARANISPLKKKHINTSEYRRFSFSSVKYQWGNLSEADRLEWTYFARNFFSYNKLGTKTELSAWNWYCKFGTIAKHWFDISITTPPPHVAMDYTPLITVYVDSSQFWVSWNTPIPSGRGIVFWQARNLDGSQPGTKNKKFAYFFNNAYSSPQQISSTFGSGVGHLDLPAPITNLWCNHFFQTVSSDGRFSNVLVQRLQQA